MDRPDGGGSCDSKDGLRALKSHESARDQLVQAAADINHALDSRNQNGVVAGGGGAAAGAGLVASSAAFSNVVGVVFLVGAAVIRVISAGRALRDYGKSTKAREQCRVARADYLKAKLMSTCPHVCWPVFVDCPCQ